MRKFLSFLGWFFGIIFLLGAIPYFWCGEFFLGLWSLVVVVVLIPPLYKYASGKLNSPFSKPKTLIFSLVVFVFLFANFIRPVIPGCMTKSEKEWMSKTLERAKAISDHCPNAIKINEIKSGDLQKTKCNKLLQVYKACSFSINKTQEDLLKYEKSKDIPSSIRLGFLIGNHIVMPTLIMPTARRQIEEAKKNIKYKWKCGDF